MKKLVISLMAVLASAGMVAAQSTVSSFAAPMLVDQINAALANPTNTTLTVTGNANVGGAITGQNVTAKNSLTVGTNATVGGTLGVTGVASFTATPVCKDGLTVGTNATVGGTLSVTGNVTASTLTASLPVFTDGSKILVSGTTGPAIIGVGGSAVITPQTPGVVTPTITVTAQRPGAQTPTITVTPQAPATVTPTITVTKETGAVTASGANSLVTPTITVTIFTTTGFDSTGAAITNAAGETVLMMTNATATCSPDLASNAVVAVLVTGGDAVMTNATAASSALPDFITNATAVSSSLLDYPTNATATCSALPDFATNATAVITITNATDTFAKP